MTKSTADMSNICELPALKSTPREAVPIETTESVSEVSSESTSESISENTSESISENTSESISENTSESISENTSESFSDTTEVTEVPAPAPVFNEFIWPLLGISIVLAIVVVIQTILLFRKKKQTEKKKAPAVAAAPAEGLSVGKVHCQGARESQQDSFGISPLELASSQGLLAVVADGMGGLANGDRVSQTAVSAMLDGFFTTSGGPDQILLELTRQANQRVNQLLGPHGIGKSGSTLVAGLVLDKQFHYLCIGDSRICLYRDGQLIQLNREHIYRHELSVQALNGIGSLRNAENHPNAGGLTSYLGMGTVKHVDIPAEPISIRGGDKFILMSDGVYNALTEQELCQELGATAEQAASGIERLIASKAYLNQDNYTAVILAF